MDNDVYNFQAAQLGDDSTGLSIHAGFPNPGEDVRSFSLDFNKLLVQHAAGTFAFRVRGTSWTRFGVFDGDLAVVDRILEPRQQDLIVWHQADESQFNISKKGGVPANVTTWGVVTTIIHHFRSPQLGGNS